MIEDRAREKVLHFQSLANRSLPLNVAKLIGSLKASVHKTMRNKGGTPFSIIREMFLYWDRENTGLADETVLTNCMKSLGVA